MTADNHKLGQENGQESTVYCEDAIDFDFLKSQTFADERLERELLELFDAQARRILSSFSTLNVQRHAENAHLLTGSARAIGAWAVAELASRYEGASPAAREDLLPALQGAVWRAARAIEGRLVAMPR